MISVFMKFTVKLHPAEDGVLLLDIIELCKDGSFILQQINVPSIARNFALLITVPAFQSAFSKHDEMLLHYHRYSIKKLKKFFN